MAPGFAFALTIPAAMAPGGWVARTYLGDEMLREKVIAGPNELLALLDMPDPAEELEAQHFAVFFGDRPMDETAALMRTTGAPFRVLVYDGDTGVFYRGVGLSFDATSRQYFAELYGFGPKGGRR